MHNHITLNKLLTFLFLIQLFTNPIQINTKILNKIQNTITNWHQILTIINTPTNITNPNKQNIILPQKPIKIQFNHISYTYPNKPTILHNINLKINPNNQITIIKKTNSNKTTFTKLLTHLINPTTKQILLDNINLHDVQFSSLQKQIIIIPQNNFLFNNTLLTNVHFTHPNTTPNKIHLTITKLKLLN